MKKLICFAIVSLMLAPLAWGFEMSTPFNFNETVLIEDAGYSSDIALMDIVSIGGASVVAVDDVCTRDNQSIKCFAIRFKDVTGTDDFGNEVSLEDVVILPASDKQGDALNVMKLIAQSFTNKLPEGTTVTVSQLRFLTEEIDFTKITKGSAPDMVHLGGLSVRVQVQVVSGNITRTDTRNINMGING